MVLQWLASMLQRLKKKEPSIKKMALSVCVGVYIAFSPFIGLHTAMVFLFAWLFSLNLVVMFAVSVAINNPWTMIPIYAGEHIFGNIVFSLCGINSFAWNPAWLTKINTWIATTIGIHGISLWAFMLGGNLLGIGISVMLYPLIKYVLRQYVQVKHDSHIQSDIYV